MITTEMVTLKGHGYLKVSKFLIWKFLAESIFTNLLSDFLERKGTGERYINAYL